MRKSVWFIIIVIVALCIWLISLHRQQVGHETPESSAPTILTQVTTNASAPVPKAVPPLNNAPPQPALVAPAIQSSNSLATNPFFERIRPEWQAPIDFYGKVVDESNNPVAGATIQFTWVETPQEALGGPGESSTASSDLNGLFKLHGAKGPSLDVRVSKQGYYTSKADAWAFQYAISGHYVPDSANPAIFHLRTKGTGAQLISIKQNYRIPRDGTPVGISLSTGQTSSDGTGDLVVQCWTSDQGKHPGQEYDWHCLVSVPRGGLVLTDEEFPFLAPESGYQPSTEIKMKTDQKNWKNDVDIKFYYELANGNVGRMTFSMIAGGQHFCMIDSALNPSGSRDLESAQ